MTDLVSGVFSDDDFVLATLQAQMQAKVSRLVEASSLSKEEIYAVAVHEIGHALGIMGHSSDRNDIMYPNTNNIGIHASARDFNTIREFYCSGKYD